MDFQAVIKAVLDAGSVESQLESLIKDREVKIKPVVDSTSKGLSSGEKRTIENHAKNTANYSTAAIQKHMQNASGTYYKSGNTQLDKGVVTSYKNREQEIKNISEQIAKDQNISQKEAASIARKTASEQQKTYRQIERDAQKASRQTEKETQSLYKHADTISESVRDKTYQAKQTQLSARLSRYSDTDHNNYKSTASALKETEAAYKSLYAAQEKYSKAPSVSSANGLVQANEKVLSSVKKLENEYKILDTQESKSLKAGQGLSKANQIRSYLEANSKASKKYGGTLEGLASNAEKAATNGEYNKIVEKFNAVKASISSEGLTGDSKFTELKRGLGQVTQLFGVYGVIQAGLGKTSEMVQNTYDVDSAMTQLQMATGASNEQASSLMKTYSKMGHQLKATGTDVAASSTEWMKQGQSIQQSNKLAESSIKLSKVGELSAEDATKYLTSARKGYNITSASGTAKIVDKLSAVDMASATDVGGLAEGMSEVATHARLSGVSMDKLLGYLATVGETTQEGMSSVGVGLNAIFSRMGNIKLARLKDYQNNGEDLDIWGAVA